MASARGIASPNANRAECRSPVRDPVQQGRTQASPFSVFAADLSPITPSRNIGFDSTWQPPVSPHLCEPSTMGGKEDGQTPCKPQFQPTQSGGKSSLRSSFEAESTTFNYLYGAEPPARDSPAQLAKMNPASQGFPASQSLVAASETDAELCKRSDQAEQGASILVANASGDEQGLERGAEKSKDAAPGTHTAQKQGSSQGTLVPAPPRSPFAAVAARLPPEEWAPSSQDEYDGNRHSVKRKALGQDGQARQRRRTLTFPPLPGRAPGHTPPTQSGQSASGALLTQERLDSSMGNLNDLPSFVQTQEQQRLTQVSAKRLAGDSASETEEFETFEDDGQDDTHSSQEQPSPCGWPSAHQTTIPANNSAQPTNRPDPAIAAAFNFGSSAGNPAARLAARAAAAASVAAAGAATPISRRQSPALPGGEMGLDTPGDLLRTGSQQGAHAALERPESRVMIDSGGAKRCNCKKSRCLKLYCDCFAAGQYCSNCTCTSCSNTADNSDGVLQMRESIRQRNPSAFDTKITKDQHKRGCHCKKSNCKKKYCECFQAGVNCGQQCKCEECHNQVEHGPPHPKKNAPRNRDLIRGAAKEAVAAQKEAMIASRRTSVRNKGKRTPAPVRAARLANLGEDEDEEEDLRPYPAAKRLATSASEGLPFSPPSLVWPSHPLHPASGVMPDGPDDNSDAILRPSDPHRMSRPTPVRLRTDSASNPLSLLHKAVAKDREKARQASSVRQDRGASMVELSGAAARQMQRAENLTDTDEALVLSSLSGLPVGDGRATPNTGSQPSASSPASNLAENYPSLSGQPADAQYFPVRPLPRQAGGQAHTVTGYAFLPSFHSPQPSFPQEAFGDGVCKQEPQDDLRSQVLQATYFQMHEQGDASLGHLSYLGGTELPEGEPLAEATPWTEHRVEDVEAGHAMDIQLDLMMQPANHIEEHLEDHPFLLPSENEEERSPGQSSEDGDENLPPLQRIPPGMLALSKLDKADSFGFAHSGRANGSPASLHGRLPLSPSRGVSNSHFGTGHHLASRGSGQLESSASPGSAGLNTAPSLNPAGIPALRAHRTTALLQPAHSLGSLPPHGQPLEHRSHSGEMFQAVLQDSFPGIFEDGSGAEAGFSGGLEQAHSMPTYPGLSPHQPGNFPHFQAQHPSVPLHRAFSCSDSAYGRPRFPYQAYAPADAPSAVPDHRSLTEHERGLDSNGQKRGSPGRQLHRRRATQSPRLPSKQTPQKSRFIRPPAASSGGSGFYRLTAGSTTIFSPPKLR